MPRSFAAIEDLDDVHAAAAGGTGFLSARPAFAGVGFGGCGRRQQIARSREVVRLGAAGEEPVVADAVEALRQHVDQHLAERGNAFPPACALSVRRLALCRFSSAAPTAHRAVPFTTGLLGDVPFFVDAHSTVKCNGQISGAEENLARGLVAEYLSGARVEFVLDPLDIGIGQNREVGTFWEVLPEEAVSVFVEAAFPRVIGLGKIG